MPIVRFLLRSGSGDHLAGAATLIELPNGTRRTGRTDADGAWRVDIYRTDQPMKFLAAAAGYLPFSKTVTPKDAATVTLKLEPSDDDRRAVLFTSSTGHIPGIEGRLNPIRDEGDRFYVYADNIAINGHVAHPASFQLGEPLHLQDVFGVETTIQFLEVASQFSLIEYTAPKPYGEG